MNERGTETPGQSDSARRAIEQGRLEQGVGNLRVHTARGTLINSAFMAGLAGLGLLRRVGVAAFLTREEFGIWGVILVTLITLSWLKQVGIGDKYIQQTELDQEAAFQKAFTLEFAMSAAYFAVCCIALPIFAVIYGRPEIIVPGAVLATAVLLTAFQTPAWIPYRKMQYARQRTLLAVDPVVSLVATMALGIAGFGYWGLVIGAVVGSAAGAAICVATSDYKIRFRYDRGTLREYVSFSWPLVGSGLSRLVVIQGGLIAANVVVGLSGIGAIGLATTIAAFADRVDGIVSSTIYPAVCSVADSVERLAEVFEKSNLVALMWAMPFATGLALFAHDLIEFGLGDEWEPAAGLIAAIGLIAGFSQIGFNWTVFMRAVNRTRPLFVGALVDLAVFALVALPAILAFGLTGYALGSAAATAAAISVRGYYLRQLFGRARLVRQTLRAVAPVLPAAALVLLPRLADSDRSPARAVAEMALYAIAVIAFTVLIERKLVTELVGYMRGRVRRSPSPSAAA
jgi:O-antigen/teichoic acid export membrane protein